MIYNPNDSDTKSAIFNMIKLSGKSCSDIKLASANIKINAGLTLPGVSSINDKIAPVFQGGASQIWNFSILTSAQIIALKKMYFGELYFSLNYFNDVAGDWVTPATGTFECDMLSHTDSALFNRVKLGKISCPTPYNPNISQDVFCNGNVIESLFDSFQRFTVVSVASGGINANSVYINIHFNGLIVDII